MTRLQRRLDTYRDADLTSYARNRLVVARLPNFDVAVANAGLAARSRGLGAVAVYLRRRESTGGLHIDLLGARHGLIRIVNHAIGVAPLPYRGRQGRNREQQSNASYQTHGHGAYLLDLPIQTRSRSMCDHRHPIALLRQS